MKKLETFDEGRQERYEHNGRIYSIVDLTMPPLEKDGSRAGGRFKEIMKEQYHPFIYELADTTDSRTVIIDRYSSIEDAKEAILLESITQEIDP